MRRSVKVALVTSVLGVAGALFIAGSGIAQSFGGPMRAGMGGPMGMGMAGPVGGFGELRHELLKSIDTNNDGAISQDEINAAVNGRFAEFDADKNGSLSLPEFEALWAALTRPVAVRTFQNLDPNGDAQISKEEIDERFGDLVQRFDRNRDGVLSAADRPHGPGRWWHGPHRHWMGGPGWNGHEDGGPQGGNGQDGNGQDGQDQ